VTWTQSFHVEHRSFPTAERGLERRFGESSAPFGAVFFCEVCSRLWASCPIQQCRSQIYVRNCSLHPQGALFGPAGSIWLDAEPEFLAALPAALVTQELNLHLDWLGDLNDREIEMSAPADPRTQPLGATPDR